MYQGKFDAKSRGQKAPKQTLEGILEERNAAKAARAAKQSQVSRRPATRPVPPNPNQPAMQPQPIRTAQPARPAQAGRQPIQPLVPEKRGPRLGSVIFYTLYFLFIFIFFAGTFFVLQWLKGWLTDYEAAQPTVKCQEVFEDLFHDPDWAKLYVDAGIEDTEFENVEQFVAYMEEKVGDKELTFVETSAGLSGDKKYIVRLEGEKIATFTLEGKSEAITDIPDWQLGKVELFFNREQGCRIQKLDGHKSYINGQELSDDYTIQIATTKVEEYLQKYSLGVVGVRVRTQEIDGLLCKPEVKIVNQKGEEMQVLYDETTNTYAEQTVSTKIPDDAKEATVGALKAYAEFMINAAGSRAAVNKYYDGSSQVYSDIIKMAGELWMNADNGHRFTDESVTNYCRYSDDVFSVRGAITMNVTCKDNTQKDYTVDQSLFFKKKNGNWVCFEMTNEDVSQPVGQVRLTFINNGNVLSNDFVDTASKQLNTPVVSVPEGKVFSGWARLVTDDKGNSSWNVVFVPDDKGVVNVNASTGLEPMTLYAIFENAPAEGGN